MKNYFKNMNSGVIFLVVNSFFTSFAFSFIPLFLYEKGVALHTIIFMVALYTGLSIILMSIINSYNLRISMIFGLFFQAMLYFPFALYTRYSIPLFIISAAFSISFFWVVLNHLYFRDLPKNTNASSSTIYIILPGVIGLFMPTVAILVIKNFNFSMVYWIAFIANMLTIILTWRLLKDETIEVKTYDSIKAFKGLKSLTIAEGALQFLNGWIIPVLSLIYIRSEKDFGFFLSYLAFLSLIISFFIAKESDKAGKRKSYVYFLFSLLIISIIILSFAKTPLVWVIAVGIFASIYNISFPLRLAMSMDLKKIDLGFWKTREIFLNIGRVITLLITALFIFYNLIWAIFVMFSVLILVYIILINYKLGKLR